jgi:hypothetical protein
MGAANRAVISQYCEKVGCKRNNHGAADTTACEMETLSNRGERPPIASWKDAQAIAPAVVERLNQDPALMLAAAANPILALRCLGYEIAPKFVDEFSDRVRLGHRGAARLRQLRREAASHLGPEVDLRVTGDVERALANRLGMKDLSRVHRDAERTSRSSGTEHSGEARTSDPLAHLADRHPVMPLILEFRQIDAQAPQLATPEIFESLRSGQRAVRGLRLRARFQSKVSSREG